MNWKIILAVVGVLLLGFFLYRQCTDEGPPDYDRIQAQQRAANETAHQTKKSAERAKQKAEAQSSARAARKERPEEQLVTLETEDFRAKLTTRGGSLAAFELKNPQYVEPPYDWSKGTRDTESKKLVPVNLVTTNSKEYEKYNPLRFEVAEGLDALLDDPDYALVEQTASSAVFRLDQPDLPVIITKKFEVDEDSGPYQIWLTVQVKNRSAEKVTFRAGVTQTGYQHPEEAEGSMFGKQPNVLQGICGDGSSVERHAFGSDELPYSGLTVAFAGLNTNYFISAMIPGDKVPTTCHIYPNTAYTPAPGATLPVITAELRFGETALAPGEAAVFKVKNVLGPKRFQLLERIGHGLEKSVDFGIFAPICYVLLIILFWFQSFVLNWGVAIILLTVVVKLLLTPLQHKSFKSGERMRALKPEIDKLNVKFKDNPQEKQKATMALYKQHGVSPLGGCLPMLLQLPIWIALYSTLRTSPELYRAEFFGWIHDLSEPDPYFITPVVMGALMFVQQRITPMAGDNLQMKMMMYVMPIMFTAMMLFLPSGLTAYILVNTVLSIAHQWYVRKRSAVLAVK
ncbi:MAG: membrane protein insertase YidC [Proteobacteria bacterium]|jgi:YidC/Oxa1 family membrane protein insertase|nr:membrane protein insertase YidC [Pseudomonadota bacterium]